MSARLFSALFVGALTAAAQFTVSPSSAQVVTYFPHIVDGGPASQRWQTKLTFFNAGATSAQIKVSFYAENGSPLSLDFGSGPSPTLDLDIPIQGTRILRSKMASSDMVVGWAVAASSVPVVGNVAFRMIQDGNDFMELTANPTQPTPFYVSTANSSVGIAVVNPGSASARVEIQLWDTEGRPAGVKTISLAPLEHVSFTVGTAFPGASNFDGSVEISGAGPSDRFIAWTVNCDNGLFSTLPDGRAGAPVSQAERILLLFTRVLAKARSFFPDFGSDPVNIVLGDAAEINAFAQGSTIQINLALAELISDSDSELAFAIAHELGHVYQNRIRRLPYYPLNREWDADVFGLTVATQAGFDPYAAAGTLAKLSMATGRAGLTSQFEDQHSGDAHRSFNERLDNLYAFLEFVCSKAPNTCSLYKAAFHPHLPPVAPLTHSGVGPSSTLR